MKRTTSYGYRVESKIRATLAAAISRGLIWKLAEEEVRSLITSACHFCGSEPKFPWPNGTSLLDPALGFVTGNVVSCCKRCNIMKGSMCEQEFIAQCKKIVDR